MATITRIEGKKGVRWRAQVRIRRDGEIVYSQTFTATKRAQAVAWAAAREAELSAPGALDRLRHRGVSVGEVLAWYEAFSDHAPGRSKLASVKRLQGLPVASLDAVALTADEVMDFARGRRAEGVSASTVGQDIIWLRLALRGYRLAKGVPVAVQAVDDAGELLRQGRVVGRSRQRDRRPSVDEMDKLMAYFESRDGRARIPMAEIVPFALFSGRRQEEICRIRWADLDDRRRAVLVRAMKHPRQVVDTWTFLTPEAWAIIERQPRSDERIFPFDAKSVGSAFTRACKMTGVLDLHFHDLRHECASWLFELGWDIPRVAGVTGHKSWASLQRYTHIQGHGVHDKWAGWRWRPTPPPASHDGPA
jgi:integrase